MSNIEANFMEDVQKFLDIVKEKTPDSYRFMEIIYDSFEETVVEFYKEHPNLSAIELICAACDLMTMSTGEIAQIAPQVVDIIPVLVTKAFIANAPVVSR